MNPYDFVPFPPAEEVERTAPAGHDGYTGLRGRLECTLEALGPLMVLDAERRPGPDAARAGAFMRDAGGRYVIPGTSLKGVVRSVFEVLVPSCVSVRSGATRRLVPQAFEACERVARLCPACRVFGAMERGRNARVHRGLVHIGQAVAAETARVLPAVQLVPLQSPRPSHEAFYSPGGRPAGRKFYFHQATLSLAQSENERARGVYVTPLAGRADGAAGAMFGFVVTFENLTERELAGLVAALVLTDRAVPGGEQVRHKVGYGKPAGLGSAEVRIVRAVVEPGGGARYRQFVQAPEVLEGDVLRAWVEARQEAFFGRPGPTVRKLIEILRYPPPAGVVYRYPGQDWFRQNPRAPLDATP